ncbi:MAG: hypothetical protein KAS94_07195 [Desulfobulbaceae bacterium]|nr:hypothetical protein [Desulfobulbaceae bacterium]
MRDKFSKLFWVVLLVISSFLLGYYLKPSGSSRAMMIGGKGSPAGSRPAPPLNFRPSLRR